MPDILQHVVVSPGEMARWPVDRKRSGDKLWAETTWGGDAPGRPKLFNWNIWPCRVVFEVKNAADVVRGEAVWRRSGRSIRLQGLKLLSAADFKEVPDARVVECSGERVVVDFRPAAGPGLYHLYYGAAEPVLFQPSPEWTKQAASGEPKSRAGALRIETRCALESFHPMETIALRSESDALLARYPGKPYLVFPEDRDRPVKLTREICADWALQGPSQDLVLSADRNEYRVFQLGIWACRKAIPDLAVRCTDIVPVGGGSVLPAARFQCLTLESRIQSLFIEKPRGPHPVPRGCTRALWCAFDLPADMAAGEYTCKIVVSPAGLPEAAVPVRLTVSGTVVADRGDDDLHRLSRLRWLESDIGLSDAVHPPYRPLKRSKKRTIATWGHAIKLGPDGLPRQLRVGEEKVLEEGIRIGGTVRGRSVSWRDRDCRFTEETGGHICWEGSARAGSLCLAVKGRMEFDGCVALDLTLQSPGPVTIDNLGLSLTWRRKHAGLASGMGYRGRREHDRTWCHRPGATHQFTPSIWMGSIHAGLGWKTWDTSAWEDAARQDAITVKETRDGVCMAAQLGRRTVTNAAPWHMTFALLPTPVKPADPRHWDFRYLHKGGDFMPSDEDTPQSFLKDNCRRLNEVKAMGVKRLNLHDWWGPAFNYPWQWEGPDNLSRLSREANKRGIHVKVYNSGRELSSLAPEFWALLYEGTRYDFLKDRDDPAVKGLFQDAWHENHLPDALPQGWPRVPPGMGNEHTVPVSNHTRNGNFYLESMRYMTQHFGTEGAYWDGADGPTLGHREMAKRLWTMFRETNLDAVTDVHHGDAQTSSPISDHMLCFPFIDSLWHGEGFD